MPELRPAGRRPALSGTWNPAKSTAPSETSASTRLTEGEPMKAATKRFVGSR
ncbi:MAG: hypothetical protein MSC30_01515 [Gaiellaceae bacterium MAG52_C11]|nr:hypothetical protein [Candidatus Gaiellasilicea maunaloa]